MITRQFLVVRFRGERYDNKVSMHDPHLLENWCNPVETMRWVFGQLYYGERRRWSENTLIPDVCGDGGRWTAEDWSGRKYEIQDTEFTNGINKEKAKPQLSSDEELRGTVQAQAIRLQQTQALNQFYVQWQPRVFQAGVAGQAQEPAEGNGEAAGGGPVQRRP